MPGTATSLKGCPLGKEEASSLCPQNTELRLGLGDSLAGSCVHTSELPTDKRAPLSLGVQHR